VLGIVGESIVGAGTLFLILTVAVAALVVLIYNRLITLRNRFLNGFSQIEVQLQRRYELIPNLVETASAYMKHEAETLTSVTQARNSAQQRCAEAAKAPDDAGAISALAVAEGTLDSALGRLNMVMENYPDLKADAQMIALHEELASTENRVSFARQSYSDSVMEYNIAREQFPALLVAKAFSFREADLFEVDEPAVRESLNVSFA